MRHSKFEWAGYSLGDGFKQELSFQDRAKPQQEFYKKASQIQQAIAALLEGETEHALHPRIKVQLTPFFTDYPSQLSAYAALGLTGFLEFKTRNHSNYLLDAIKEYLKQPHKIDNVRVDKKEYQQVIRTVCEWVWNRLILEDLSRTTAKAPLEIYRLFVASQENLRFSCISEIIRAVVLFGDVLPPLEKLNLHPLTQAIIEKCIHISMPYFIRINNAPANEFPKLGVIWIRKMSKTLSTYLPPPKPAYNIDDLNEILNKLNLELENIDKDKDHDHQKNSPLPVSETVDTDKEDKQTQPPYLNRLKSGNGNQSDFRFNALDAPQPPALAPPESVAGHIAQARSSNKETTDPNLNSNHPTADGPNKDDPGLNDIMKDLNKALNQAGRQMNNFEDIRYDRLKNNQLFRPFEKGPIQGFSMEGHEIKQKFGDQEAGGHLFDKQLPTSNDWQSVQNLRQEAFPITRQLVKNLYPALEHQPRAQAFRSNGLIDSRRLALSNFSTTVFKRYQQQSLNSRNGRPLLVIACDGSASLGKKEMTTLKVLATAFLESSVKSRLQVMAALYHSDSIHNAPVVQWIYHPHKSPMNSPKQGINALAALPKSGQGTQSDAISLSFVLNEAKKLARNNMTYLVLLTDAKWNQSYKQKLKDLSATEEVSGTFENAYKEFAGKLDVTIIATKAKTGLEDLVNKSIHIDKAEQADPFRVAEKIALYVASCLRERKHINFL
jgi:Mg-chelatase subunit ChlD